MPPKRKPMTFGQAQDEGVRRTVFDQAGAPAVETTRVEPAPAPDRAPAAPPEDDQPATMRLGASISARQMEAVRAAWLSDLDHHDNPARSQARWIVRAIQSYLAMPPARRRANLAKLDSAMMAGRKSPYSLQVPVGMKAALADAVRAERAAGRHVPASQLVREALAVAAARAAERAGQAP